MATDTPEWGVPAALRSPDLARRPDASALPSTTSDDFCWWAGVYLGDGYLHHRGPWTSVEIAVDASDTALVDELIRVTDALFGIRMTLANDGYRLTGHGTAALAEFLELNGLGGTARTKRVPGWVFGLPRSERLALVSGFLDSDGYVRNHSTAKDVVVTSASPHLLGDIRELVHLCGIGSSRVIEVSNRHPIDRDRMMTAYHLRLSGNFDQLAPRSPRRAERMHRRAFVHAYRTVKGSDIRAHTSGMLGFVRVESIESVGVEPTYDVEVAGHHNFVAEGFVVHNSEVVYHKNREDLERQGVLFSDMDSAVREHPEIVRKWFGRIIPPNDNKFAALNSAVWSGGSFIYVPPGVTVEMPLQAYFRINAENMGQFERTLIIADEGSKVHYVEGCSAPVYSTDSLHSAVVELVALQGGRITYTTIQNWSNNVYNLVTKRARAEAEAHVEWIDGNIGCLAQGSTVTTPSGPKPIELVVPGEQVLSFDEARGELCFRRVTAKRFSGQQRVREVRLGTRSLRVTDNHPFLSSTYDPDRAKRLGRYALGYVRADALAQAVVPVTSIDYGHPHKLRLPETMTVFRGGNQHASDFVSRRARPVRLAAPEETTDELMWLFGLFVGDGSNERASVELADLLELNGFASGAAAKRLPDWILELPESQRLAFV
ncbi:MAG TPA: SufD family Fe-S cluster assembly protein, partial [Acidimicrobiales bacterium]|nr:SufD family Fe-S cluster assembly protein [Acidimicrobiales bacterium]